MLKAISLFTGVGGLDYGFEAAGFETAVAVEFDRVACRTLQSNRPGWRPICRDIHQVEVSELLSTAGLQTEEADVLIGGPPCQPFSKSGYWVRGDALRLKDPRATTLEAYLRILEGTRPRAFLLENVTGLAYASKQEGLNQILAGIDAINKRTGTRYKPYWQIVDAADYGVPQHRERVLIVGSRDGKPFRFPEPTHGPDRPQSYRTAWDAIGDLPAQPNDPSVKAGGKWAELLSSIPEGQNYLWHTERGGGLPLFGWRTRYWNFLLKLAKDRPSWTIQAQPGSATGPFHWANRRLTGLELCRLQTFPERLAFDCSRNEIQRLLGNAVPSLLAEVIAREIRRQLLGQPRASRSVKLMPPSRGAPPAPEPVKGVAPKFAALAGEHAPHPGEGLGNRAKQRAQAA